MWSKSLVLGKLDNLTLVPSQQSVLDNGVCLDQWHSPRDQASQPRNDFVRHLLVSVKAHRQVSVLLLANLDRIMEHHFKLKEAMEDAHVGAILLPGTRD